jgi:hypothetical protein
MKEGVAANVRLSEKPGKDSEARLHQGVSQYDTFTRKVSLAR